LSHWEVSNGEGTEGEVELAPAGILTLLGTVAMRGLLLNSFTTKPPEGAGLVIVTVACDENPPLTVCGFKVTVVTVVATVDPLSCR